MPYGYDLKNGELVKNQEQASIVRNIFHMRDNLKMQFKDIAKKLTADGVPKPSAGKGWKTTRNTAWSSSAVWYIHKNPLYAGVYEYKEIKIKKPELKIKGAA